MNRKKKTKYKGFNLVKGTAGILLDGIYLKEDNSEIIVSLAWGGIFHFKPVEEGEKLAEIL